MELIAIFIIGLCLALNYHWYRLGKTDLLEFLLKFFVTGFLTLIMGNMLDLAPRQVDMATTLFMLLVLVAFFAWLWQTKQKNRIVQTILPIPLLIAVTGLLQINNAIIQSFLTASLMVTVEVFHSLYLAQE